MAKVTGTDAVLKKLTKAGNSLETSLGAALYEFGADTMRAAKALTPVDYDVLRPSGYTTPPEQRGEVILVELGYGGPASPYAVIQHENKQYRHPNGGQAKYLEEPVFARSGGMKAWLVSRVASVMAGGAPLLWKKAPDMPQTPWEVGTIVALKTALKQFGLKRYKVPRSAKSPHMQPLIEEAKSALLKSGITPKPRRKRGG